MPRTWKAKNKKGIMFITRPKPGKKMLYSMPLITLLKEMLGLARTSKEAKFILTEKNVLVNGTRVNEPKYPVGVFDCIEIKELGQFYRMVLDRGGRLHLVSTDRKDAELRPVKVKCKTMLKKGKVQLNFSDGTNLIADKGYAVGDVLLLKLPKTIESVIKLEKGALVYIVGGKNSGKTGVVKDIAPDGVTFTADSRDFKTLKEYAFQIGKDKPVIKLND